MKPTGQHSKFRSKAKIPNDSPRSEARPAKNDNTLLALSCGDYSATAKAIRKILPDGSSQEICGGLKLQAFVRTLGGDNETILIQLVIKVVTGETVELLVAPSDFNNPSRLIDKLLDRGWPVFDKVETRRMLAEIQLRYPPRQIVWQTALPGWHKALQDEPYLYVTNRGTFKSAESVTDVVLSAGVNAGFDSEGELNSWNENIGQLCVGNPLLQFCVCHALASLLLRFSGLPNFGFLIVGNSKTGKTISMRIAASVFGNSSFVLNWNATVNALDLMARSRADSLLILDELAEGDPKAVSESIYRLMNGASKQRLGTDGELESAPLFRGLVLASGELDLREHLKQSGIDVKQGQLTRLISIPVPEDCGVFKTLHGHATGSALGGTFAQSTNVHFGALAPDFINHLVKEQEALRVDIPIRVRKVANQLLGFLGEIPDRGAYHSVAQSFALVAIAGELAIENKLLTWDRFIANKAVKKCFLAWARYDQKNKVFSEQDVLIFFQNYFRSEAGGKFTPFRGHDSENEGELAGYMHVLDGVNVYLVKPSYFESILCRQFGKSMAVGMLLQRNLLLTGARGTPTRQLTLPKTRQCGGQTKASYYVIREEIMRV